MIIFKKVVCDCQQCGIKLLSIYGFIESFLYLMVNLGDLVLCMMNIDGYVVIGVEIKIVDEDCNMFLVGYEGEEVLCGLNVFMGYLDELEFIVCVLDNEGWYYSGDFCCMDEDGYIKIIGCKKDIIICGGENISSCEVEDILLQYFCIYDVCVVVMFDECLGECLCVYVVLKLLYFLLMLEEVIVFFS